jgi:hypothetical protein
MGYNPGLQEQEPASLQGVRTWGYGAAVQSMRLGSGGGWGPCPRGAHSGSGDTLGTSPPCTLEQEQPEKSKLQSSS